MPTKLKAVAPKAAGPSKPKVLIFGKPSVGKTWTALDFPSVYYIDTEGGANLDHYTDKLARSGGVYFGPEQGAIFFDDVLDQVRALATERHEYRTLVIDSITKLFSLEVAREADRLSSEGKKNEFGADRKPAVSYMRQLVSWLMRLDMNVVMIAHEKVLWGTDQYGQRTEVGVTFDCWDKLEYELHLCLNITKDGPQRWAKVRKSRLEGFQDAAVFPWSYDHFADRYGRSVIEKPSSQIEIASEAQLAEITRLLDIVKLPDGLTDKWLAAANVQSFKEMDANKISKCIENLKERMQTKQPVSEETV